MSGIENRDPFGRPERVGLWAGIASVAVVVIAGSVWPPPARSGTPPFDTEQSTQRKHRATRDDLAARHGARARALRRGLIGRPRHVRPCLWRLRRGNVQLAVAADGILSAAEPRLRCRN